MSKTICERQYSSFYFPKDTFDGVPISMANHPKSIAIFGRNWTGIVGVFHEKFDIIGLIAPVKFGEKPPRCLFCRSWSDRASDEGFHSCADRPHHTARTLYHRGRSSFRQPQAVPQKLSRSAVDQLYEPSCEWRRDSG